MNKAIEMANDKVLEIIKTARPFLIDVIPAGEAIAVLKDKKTLLHAGPPITYKDMTGPMQGACIGAILFEGWANNETDAIKQLLDEKITFIPCHDVSAVGPMGGITSGNMPLLKVKNITHGNYAYCNLNEGIGKVMRFGAYNDEVQTRLHWIKNVLAPTLSKSLMLFQEGIDLTSLMSQAITMGDEFHQRNIAASALLLRTLCPYIASLNISTTEKEEVLSFLGKTDQFFLNIAMAYCKSVMDAAHTVGEGTIVTAMTRNGKDFGIRVSGLGNKWFTAPVNTPQGLFFTGYSQEEANADIGDSAITETFGIGAMAMIAAPGVTRFVGAGGFDDALDISNEMAEICLAQNSALAIPTWNFKGACLGIDVRLVVETGITPTINTGIAHKNAGIGQIGAGTVKAPIACLKRL